MKVLESLRQARFRIGAIFLVWMLSLWPAHAQPEFLEPEQAFRLSVDSTDPGKVLLQWQIAPGYYLYRDRIAVESATGGAIGAVARPPGERKLDPNFGAVDVYHGSVQVQVDAANARELRVEWQGCADAGLCYPPQQQRVTLAAASQPPGPVEPPTAAPTAFWSDSGISRVLTERSLAWTLPLSFLLGLALAFTPCVLPMLPIVSGIVVGSQAGPRRGFMLSLAFVLAMALVYAGLGVLAALAGASLQAWMQNPWTIGVFAAVFVVLAGAMFGFFELQLPALLRDRLGRSRATGGSVAGAAAMGVVSALLVGPCMTAPLAGTLLYIAQSGNVAQGALLLLALGLGMGTPLLVVSTAGARWLPRPGAWMNRVKAAFGFLMLGTAVWMLQRVIPEPVALLLWGALLTALAVTLWQAAAASAPAGGAARTVLLSTAAVAALWGGAMVLGAATGATDPVRPLGGFAQARAAGAGEAPRAPFEVFTDPALLQARLDAARAQGQPALVDFSADWCTSCKTIDREVFGDPQVLRALDGLVLLRADVTAATRAQQDWMRSRQVMGPPTVMLFDERGSERRAERIVGEFEARELLARTTQGGT